MPIEVPIVPPPSGFMRDLETCLTYHLTNLGRTELEKRLRKCFFDEIYVDRPELEQLKAQQRDRGFFIVTGLTGCGKTTLLLRFLGELRREAHANGEPRFVHYLNLYERQTSVLQHTISHPKGAVCRVMADDIIGRLRKTKKDWYREFQAYRWREHSRFSDFADAAYDLLDLETDDDWRRARNDERISDVYHRCLNTQSDPDHDLDIVIAFLTQKTGRPPTLILDNVDGLPYAVHVQVAQKCQERLQRLCRAILAMRSMNLARLEHCDGRLGVLGGEMRIVSRDSFTGEEHQDGIELDGGDLIQEFLRKRFEFLESNPGITDSDKDLLGTIRKSFEETLGDEGAKSVVALFDLWESRSLRHVAADLASLAARAASSLDPAYPKASVLPATSGGVRRARSCAFKYMITGPQDLAYDQADGAPNIFDDEFANELVPFPRLALLSILANIKTVKGKPRRRIEFKEVLETLGALRFEPEQVAELLNSLAGGWDASELDASTLFRDFPLHGFGFIYIHSRTRRLAVESRAKTQIEIQPRGAFLLSTLGRANEYIFWMAISAGYDDKLHYKQTKNETRRLRTAVQYLDEVIWPRFEEAHRMISQEGAPSATQFAHARAFPGGIPATAERIVRSVSRFCSEVRKELNEENKTQPKRPNLKDDLERIAGVERTLFRLEASIESCKGA